MTRLDKIFKLKGTTVTNKIDVYRCSDSELDKLVEISNLEAKQIPRSSGDWQFVNQLITNQSVKPSVGRFS